MEEVCEKFSIKYKVTQLDPICYTEKKKPKQPIYPILMQILNFRKTREKQEASNRLASGKHSVKLFEVPYEGKDSTEFSC